MAAIDGSSEGLDIGAVVQATFSAIRRNIVTYLVLAAILAGIPALLTGWLQWGTLRGMSTGDLGAFASAKNLPSNGVAVLISIIANSILQGALVHITTADLVGRRATVADGLATGLRNFLPLIAVAILFGVAMVFGLLLLIVPGVILGVMWCVTVPALIVERTTISSSFTRSAQLTKGSRWRIFGLVVIALVIGFVIRAVLDAVFGGAPGLMAGHPLALVGILIGAIINGVIGAVGVSVLYTELRRLRDGVSVTDLAAVFD
jgi:hypothetical protein